MKYHSSMLKKYISIDDSPANIAQNLIVKSCEIEEIIQRNISDSIVIWYIKSFRKHPDADKLNVCMVDCGDKWEYQIICGWENVAEGIFVPVALPGTVFEKVGMIIEKRMMRWVESNGMICSKEELDINEDVDLHNIWALNDDFDDIEKSDLWLPLNQKYPWLNSFVLDVDNKWLTNRPDLIGHFGMAVDLNAIYDSKIRFSKVSERIKEIQDTNILDVFANSKKLERNVIGKSDWLNSYTLLEIKNINIAKTSFFTRLQMIDLWSNPRNNWVDFSNVFMTLTGQPLHFFDAEKVDWDIIVRNAEEWEEFVDLFEEKHILKSSDILITDQSKILALAGVVWWLDSGITENTKNILVEIANFDPVPVRKTGNRLWLRTDAAIRYEKNINPWRSIYVLLLFLDELKFFAKDLWEFEIWGLSYYIKEWLKRNKEIKINLDDIEKSIFGEKIEWFQEKAKEILEKLWFLLKEDSVVVPIRRSPSDINIQEDITEEIIRIYGYDKIVWKAMMSNIEFVEYSPEVKMIRDIESVFVNNFRFDQIETYPRVGQKALKEFGSDAENCFDLQNSVNVDTPYLRDKMIYNLLTYVAKNNKFFDQFSIFDIWKIWNKQESKKSDWQLQYAKDFIKESWELGAFVYQKDIKSWEDDSFLMTKSLLKPLFKNLWIPQNFELEASNFEFFHPKKQADIIINGINVWNIATIHPLILKNHKIPETAGLTYLSLNLEKLLELKKINIDSQSKYETLQDQIVWRDLCFVCDTTNSFESIISAIKSIKEISDIEIFDVYQWQNLWEWKKSISLQIKIPWDGKLNTEQINEIMNKAISKVEKSGWKLRE